MTKQNILVIVPHDAALVEYIKTFKSQNYRVNPIFVFNYKSKCLATLHDYGWLYIEKGITHKRNNTKASTIKRIIKSLFDNTYIGCFAQANLCLNYLSGKLVKKIKSDQEFLKDIVDNYSIKTIVIATDRSVGIESSAYFLGLEKNIKIILISFAYSADFKSSYMLRKNRIYDPRFNKIENNLNKNVQYGNKAFFRPYEANALAILGEFPTNPWVLGAGLSDLMLVESERERNRLISMGGNPKKYVVTGTASQDALYEKKLLKSITKDKLFKRYGLKSKKLILIALPQYYEHGLCSKKQHFSIISDMCSKISELNAELILSLHPKMNIDDYRYLERQFSVKLIEEPLSDVIITADLFLATYSSTIVWAVLCGIPTIIFDHLSMNYNDFYSEFNIPIENNNNSLLLTAELYLKNKDLNSGVCVPKYDKNLVNLLSPFDGECTNRIVDALY